jgi:hypothetical protein
MVRDQEITESNPYTFEQIKENIEKALIDFKGKYDIIKVPNITNICYGRGVGYKIEEIVLPKEIQNISATKIRQGLVKNEI